jgi:hypothetical protein
MKLLEKNKYHLVENPLKEVSVNNLFARAVVENQIEGKIYVDDTDAPKTFYVLHPYGMSLLFGEYENEEFNSKFLDYALNTNKIRKKTEWLQAFPELWNKKLKELFRNNLIISKGDESVENNRIEENTRVNFKFNKEKYLELKKNYQNNNYQIERTTKEMYENMNGSVVPKYFWNNSEQFCNKGVGFSLIYENTIVSTAYSAFVFEKKLELGIETTINSREKGFAVFTCSALIDYCLDNNLEPIWACRFENYGSYKLAMKLGFEPTIYLPYYKLCN